MKKQAQFALSVASAAICAHAAVAQPMAWGSHLQGANLYEVDLATGTATLVGPLGASGVTGLAHDSITNTLYGIDRDTDTLVKINTTTGAASIIGSLGINTSAGGAAFDQNTGRLYYNDNSTSSLYTVNTSTGAATLIGPNGVGLMQGLAFDPNSNTLWATASTGQALYRMNTSTGAATFVAPLGDIVSDHGLGFDAASNTLYLAEANESPNNLYKVNTSTGAVSTVGTLAEGLQGFTVQQFGLSPCDDPVLLVQPPDQFTANRSDLDPTASAEQAENVAFAQDVTIRSIRWWGVYASADTPLTDDFEFRVYEDAGGVPAASPIATFHISTAARALTGLSTAGFDEYIYAVDLPAPLTLEAGKRYWLTLINDTTDDTDDDWYWSTSAVGDNVRAQRVPADTGAWSAFGPDRAIELCGVPCTLDCQPDIDGDGFVDGADLAALLASWGQCPAPMPILAPLEPRRDALQNTHDTDAGSLIRN